MPQSRATYAPYDLWDALIEGQTRETSLERRGRTDPPRGTSRWNACARREVFSEVFAKRKSKERGKEEIHVYTHDRKAANTRKTDSGCGSEVEGRPLVSVFVVGRGGLAFVLVCLGRLGLVLGIGLGRGE
jgi:hypothetical protein